MVHCNGKRENLGVLVPCQNGFTLEKRVPVKQLSGAAPSFLITAHHESAEGKFVPVCPEVPFRYISRLRNACLVYRNGQAGILIDDPMLEE